MKICTKSGDNSTTSFIIEHLNSLFTLKTISAFSSNLSNKFLNSLMLMKNHLFYVFIFRPLNLFPFRIYIVFELV